VKSTGQIAWDRCRSSRGHEEVCCRGMGDCLSGDMHGVCVRMSSTFGPKCRLWMDGCASGTLSRMVQPQSMSSTVKVIDCLAVSGVCVNVVNFRNACRVSVMDASDTLSHMMQPQ